MFDIYYFRIYLSMAIVNNTIVRIVMPTSSHMRRLARTDMPSAAPKIKSSWRNATTNYSFRSCHLNNAEQMMRQPIYE
jgi:hypothetical protein